MGLVIADHGDCLVTAAATTTAAVSVQPHTQNIYKKKVGKHTTFISFTDVAT